MPVETVPREAAVSVRERETSRNRRCQRRGRRALGRCERRLLRMVGVRLVWEGVAERCVTSPTPTFPPFPFVLSRGPCAFPAPSRGRTPVCAGHKGAGSRGPRTPRRGSGGWVQRGRTHSRCLWTPQRLQRRDTQLGPSAPGKFHRSGHACCSTAPPAGQKQRRGGCPRPFLPPALIWKMSIQYK